jgi:hypothetical protein
MPKWPVVGAPGFEPGNGGTKNRCLTAWRRPSRVIAFTRVARPQRAPGTPPGVGSASARIDQQQRRRRGSARRRRQHLPDAAASGRARRPTQTGTSAPSPAPPRPAAPHASPAPQPVQRAQRRRRIRAAAADARGHRQCLSSRSAARGTPGRRRQARAARSTRLSGSAAAPPASGPVTPGVSPSPARLQRRPRRRRPPGCRAGDSRPRAGPVTCR